jgi:hypothetical protein
MKYKYATAAATNYTWAPEDWNRAPEMLAQIVHIHSIFVLICAIISKYTG